jgi:hypothetical protein
MRKLILILGLFSLLTLGFISCDEDDNNTNTNTNNGGNDESNNCYCTVTVISVVTGNESISDPILVMNFNGDCSYVTWNNLPNSANWDPAMLEGTGMEERVTCVETEDTISSHYPGGVSR